MCASSSAAARVQGRRCVCLSIGLSMIWIALRFPQLTLETVSRSHAPHERRSLPWAIVEDRRVLACDARAETLGLRAGMGLAAAWALAPRLQVRERDSDAECAALEGIAAWLCRFTPAVSLERPHGVLAEVHGSLRHFGGLQTLVLRIREGIAALGFSARLTVAPSAQGAWLLTFGEGATTPVLEDFSVLRDALAHLPVEAVCTTDEGRELLNRIGITTVRQLLRLPRTGVTRRFGPALLERLDRALGMQPDPRCFFAPPERFAAALELPAEVEHAEGVLFAARRLLLQLEGLLTARQSGVRQFLVMLEHRGLPPTRIEVGLASPGREAGRFDALLRERLAGHRLAAPVEAIRIEADTFIPFGGMTRGLFGDAREETEAWARLVERLQARLGQDAVYGLGLNADHRPERAWRRLVPDAAKQGREENLFGPRPLWLVEPPRSLDERGGVPQQNGPLALLAGPERIESGWWDGALIRRDYFIACAAGTTLLWIYREPGGGWYLHGIFA